MTEYDLGKVVGDDGDPGNGIASIEKTGTSGLVDTYTITYDDGDTDTFTVTNGSDASVTIQTSWGSTTSDSKVPSEKLTKDTLDNKASSTHTHGNLTNDGKVGSNANYFVVTGTSGAITSQQKIGNIDTSGKIGSTSGKPIITTTGGTVTTGSFGTSSGTFAEGNHTHSGYISTSSTTGLVKNDGSIDTTTYLSSLPSHTHGNLSNDGKIGSNANYFVYTTTSGQVTSKQKIGNIDTSGAIGSTSGLPIITTTSGVLTTGSFGTGSGTFAEGNHTHSGYVSATKVTSWSSTVSDSNVPSEKLVKDYIDNQIGTAIQYIQQ